MPPANELGQWAGVDLSEYAIKLLFDEVLGQQQAQALSGFLQRTDVQLVALHLNLSSHLDAATAAELLASVDRRAHTLGCPQLLVDGAANGLLPKALRLALAGSKVCLRDHHVRERIFLDLGRALEQAQDAVRQFLSVDTAGVNPVQDGSPRPFIRKINHEVEYRVMAGYIQLHG